MHILEVVFLLLLPALAACLSFYDIVVLLKKGLKGQTITHHEVFFTCSQFTSWVSLLNLLLSWLKYVCNEWWFRSDKKKKKKSDGFVTWVLIYCLCWLSCSSVVGDCHAILEKQTLVPYIFQSCLVFLVDCETSPGNPSLADKTFVISGTFILFYLFFAMSII